MNIDQDSVARRLREARLNCGLTQEAAAEAVGLLRTAVVNIEAGKRELSTLELLRFSRTYQRPVSFFLEPYNDVDIELADLVLARQLPGYQNDRLVKHALNWCSDICRIGIKLETLLGRRPRTNAPAYNLPAPRQVGEALDQGAYVAEEERRRLGLGFAPIADVSDVIGTQGIWASAIELPDEMSGLFMQHSSIRSVIIVNCKHARSRKRFSYAHEYGHAILDRDMFAIASTDKNSQELIEMRANAFAASFLMPQAGLQWFLGLLDKGGSFRKLDAPTGYSDLSDRDRGPEIRSTHRPQDITFKDVAMLARHFGTSYESAVYRLRSARVIKPSERLALLDPEQIKAAKSFVELFHTEPRPTPDKDLVREVANLAIEAFLRDIIKPKQMKELSGKLDIPVARLMELARRAMP